MKMLVPVVALLISFVVLCLGHGLQSVLLPTRAALEGYSDAALGVLMASYYAGFIAGTLLSPRLIARVGHINVFAAMAAGACAVMLCYPLSTTPVAWVVLRFIYGLCLVHLYNVMESWLSGIAEDGNRGRVFSVYMILNLLAMSIGQFLFYATVVGGFQMFSFAAILFSLALLPLLLSRIHRPAQAPVTESFGMKKLFAVSPLGAWGALISGLISGAYWGLTAPYVLNLGYSQAHVAWFMGVSLLGGLAAQWPLGALSDRINRRYVILLAALLTIGPLFLLAWIAVDPRPALTYGTGGLLVLAALFGAGFHPLYSLCIAHANDFVPRDQFVHASAGLILVQSCGAVAGSIVSGGLLYYGGNVMVYGYITALATALALYTLARLAENRMPTYAMPFQLVTRTGMAAFLMDPRAPQR